MLKLILFDIDGTLLTSIGTGRTAVLEAMQDVCGRAVDVAGVQFAGRTDPAIIEDILILNGFEQDSIENLLEACLSAYASCLMRSLTPSSVHVYPGVLDLIRRLDAADDILLGLLTGNLRETAYLKLHAAGLGSYFRFGAFGSDHSDRDELPEIAVQRAVAFSGNHFSPGQVVIIGDTPHDFDCGRNHGAHCVGVSTGTFSMDELAAHQPDVLMADFQNPLELYAFLDRI